MASRNPNDYNNGKRIILYENIDDFRDIILNIQLKLLVSEKAENDLLLKKLKKSESDKEKIQILNTEL